MSKSGYNEGMFESFALAKQLLPVDFLSDHHWPLTAPNGKME